MKCTMYIFIKYGFNSFSLFLWCEFVHMFVRKIPPYVKKNTTRVWKCTKKIAPENAPKNEEYDNNNVSKYTGLSKWCILSRILHMFVRRLYTGLSRKCAFSTKIAFHTCVPLSCFIFCGQLCIQTRPCWCFYFFGTNPCIKWCIIWYVHHLFHTALARYLHQL